jgi:hypothetical protein
MLLKRRKRMSRIERDHDGLFTGAVLAQEETQIAFVLPCQYEGVGVLASNRAPTLPGGNSTERGWATPESTTFKPCNPVTVCRDLTVVIEMVEPGCAETDPLQKLAMK